MLGREWTGGPGTNIADVYSCVSDIASSTKGFPATPKKPMDRELINTGTDKRFVRRDQHGLSQDAKEKATARVKEGQGDRGHWKPG
jgi:hypothetical protein